MPHHRLWEPRRAKGKTSFFADEHASHDSALVFSAAPLKPGRNSNGLSDFASIDLHSAFHGRYLCLNQHAGYQRKGSNCHKALSKGSAHRQGMIQTQNDNQLKLKSFDKFLTLSPIALRSLPSMVLSLARTPLLHAPVHSLALRSVLSAQCAPLTALPLPPKPSWATHLKSSCSKPPLMLSFVSS